MIFSLVTNPICCQVTPRSLYLVTALLIQHGVMTLEEVYPMLRPADSEIVKLSEKDTRDAKEFVRRLNVVSTQGKDDKDEEEKSGEPHENNQKFGLLWALLQTGAWREAERVLCQVLP
jgi:THO complex subunit 2